MSSTTHSASVLRVIQLIALSLFVILSSLAPSSTAAPIGGPKSDLVDLFARACPSIADMRLDVRAYLNANGNPKIYFWSAPATEKDIRDSLAGQNFATYLKIMTPALRAKYDAACGGSAAHQHKVVPSFSAAMALEASGDVVGFKKGTVAPKSVWAVHELPNLKVNPAVTTVREYDVATKQYTNVHTKKRTPSPSPPPSPTKGKAIKKK